MDDHHPDPSYPTLSNTLHKPNKAVACILAMARATPSNCIDQRTYADFYFDVTNSSHKTELKKKFARICEKSGINTRYSILTEDFLKAHPEFYTPGKPSLEERNAIFAKEVPKLAHEAGVKALREWGRPASDITHLIVSTLTGIAIPGADVALVKSLGLSLNVNRIMLYMLGCYAGISAIRIAKDIAENNPSARILICCSELSAPTFRAPDEKFTYDLVATALFGDGASGVIVGANPNPLSPSANHLSYNMGWMMNSCANGIPSPNPSPSLNVAANGVVGDMDGPDLSPCSLQNGAIPNPNSSHARHNPNHKAAMEKVLYEIHWVGETLAADTDHIIEGTLKLDGLQFYLDRTLPSLVGKHVGPFCRRVLEQVKDEEGRKKSALGLGLGEEGKPWLGLGYNDVFWAVHAGGPAILNEVEAAMELKEGKLGASREILRKYGNISASTVLFVLDELAQSPHLDDSEWGIAVAFGPGVTIEGALLRRPRPT
eukprot:c19321_g1_i1 orf=149-1612(+)